MMVIRFLSILIFTFALGLFILGIITWWIERENRRKFGLAMMGSGLVVAAGYAFLGSRFSIALLGRLVIAVDLPQLMQTAMVYTLGALSGVGLAGGLFLWISGRLVQPTRLERQVFIFLALVLFVALAVSVAAVQISR